MVHTKMFKTVSSLLGVCLLAISWNAQAASLNLTLLDSPDVASFFINTSYDANAGELNAVGFALSFDSGTGTLPVAGGLYVLQASIDNAGNLLSGSIEIRGTIASIGANSGTLLTGNLTAFGFGVGDPLEFLFETTGGDLASLYGSTGGIILSQTGFGGSFSSDFGNATAVSDVAAVVPVPAAVWLMLSAVAGLVSIRRR